MARLVDPIVRQPLPYGLFSVLVPRSSAEPYWQAGDGIAWETLSCAPASGLGAASCDPEVDTEGLPKNLDHGTGDLGEATPFGVYGVFACSPVGYTPERAYELAQEHLLTREEAFVEQTIWTGDLGNTGFAEGAQTITAGSNKLVNAIARLDAWLATDYGSLGVIHMTREAATVGLAKSVLEKRGNALYTALGTPVVAGTGYPGTGPTGQAAAAGSSWLYATPALLGYRSEVFPGATPASAGLDRSTNDMHAVAERTYVVGWDPCGVAAILATLEA